MTLRVTLEIVPHGNEHLKYPIEVINISNLGSHNNLSKQYEYVVEYQDYKNYTDETPRVYHNRDDSSLELVRKALNRLLDE